MYQPAPEPGVESPTNQNAAASTMPGWIPKWIPVPEILPRQSLHSQDFPADNMDMTPFSKIQQKGQI